MKKKLKIVNIISSLNPIYGGPSANFVQTSKKLSESRFDVTVLTYDNKNFIKKNKIKNGDLTSLIKIVEFYENNTSI